MKCVSVWIRHWIQKKVNDLRFFPVKCGFKWIMTHQRHLPDAWNWVRLNFSATCAFITCIHTHSYVPGCLYFGICSRSLHWSVVSSTEDQLSRIHFSAALLPCVCVYWAVDRFSLIHKSCSGRILLDHRLIGTGGARSFIIKKPAPRYILHPYTCYDIPTQREMMHRFV